MEKKKIIILSISIIIFIIMLIGIFIIINIDKYRKIEIIDIGNNLQELSISVQDNSLTNTEITVIFTSDNEFVCTTSSGDDFILSSFGDNKWNELAPIKGNWNSTEMENYNPATKELKETLSWKEKYGELKKGRYKLERKILIDGNEENYYIEFEIK